MQGTFTFLTEASSISGNVYTNSINPSSDVSLLVPADKYPLMKEFIKEVNCNGTGEHIQFHVMPENKKQLRRITIASVTDEVKVLEVVEKNLSPHLTIKF